MHDYFKNLHQLLSIEQKTDQEQYRQLLEQKSVHARREAGVTWYPIIIKSTEVTYGDYIDIEIERPADYTDGHQLRSGMPVALFSQQNPKEFRIEGVVSFLRANRMKISTRVDELPSWVKQGKLGVDMLFDDNSYTEMFNALQHASDEAIAQKNELVATILGANIAQLNTGINIVLPHTHLNQYQKNAVVQMVQAYQLAIVHGPPGTGKTTTIVAGILELLKHGAPRILVCAPSNVAVDVLTEKLALSKVNVVRIGNPVRISQTVLEHSLDYKLSIHESNKQVKQLRKQSAEYINMAHKYKRNFGKAEREQRKALFSEAHKIVKEIQNIEDYISNDVLNKAQVITATLVGASHYSIKQLEFDIAIIDEAAQALEPACWIPILKCKKLILAGDHCQLPPTIKSDIAAQQGLATTLMEKLTHQQQGVVSLLQQQYRMHEQIMTLPSDIFYDGKLVAHENNAHHLVFKEDAPMQFVDTAGCGYEEVVEDTAIHNPEEAALVLRHLTQYAEQLVNISPKPSIAIISPYKQQVLYLQQLLAEHSVLQVSALDISVNTIDSYQGQERDVVYISLVRCNDKNIIGFLSDTRRMNVAMTRARKKLVMFGDSVTLCKSDFYNTIINYCQQNDLYESAWTYFE